ncbi:guanine nucleotide-binding protein subunit alpha [Rhizophlyctis rosea]|uniref:Guanine nucleotide-binding protein subunit alpha n=1 Tax=Rhizophlyctis rosea TaxID=64517 RepID=A0AAD5SI77_9FUNG|nr:guanine nucleotide-binding protein subunit alpha [Rhizophlyctis rosea]
MEELYKCSECSTVIGSLDYIQNHIRDARHYLPPQPVPLYRDHDDTPSESASERRKFRQLTGRKIGRKGHKSAGQAHPTPINPTPVNPTPPPSAPPSQPPSTPSSATPSAPTSPPQSPSPSAPSSAPESASSSAPASTPNTLRLAKAPFLPPLAEKDENEPPEPGTAQVEGEMSAGANNYIPINESVLERTVKGKDGDGEASGASRVSDEVRDELDGKEVREGLAAPLSDRTAHMGVDLPYSIQECEPFKEIIFSNIVQSMRVILEAMTAMGIPLARQENNRHRAMILEPLGPNEVDWFSPEIAEALRALRHDENVLVAFARIREYHLNDSAR